MFISYRVLFLESSDSSSKQRPVADEANFGNEEFDEDGYNGEFQDDQEDGDGGQQASNVAQLAPNQIFVTLSYTLMNQVKQMARIEGVGQQDMIVELLAEALTRRSYEDASKPAPSHLMTRSGYLGPDVNGNQMSHHQQQYNNQQNGNNRRPQNNNHNQKRNFNGNSNVNGNVNGNSYSGSHSNSGNNRNFNNNNGSRYNNNNSAKSRFPNQNQNRQSNQSYNQQQAQQSGSHQDTGVATASANNIDSQGEKE